MIFGSWGILDKRFDEWFKHVRTKLPNCDLFQYSFFHDWNVYDCKNLDLHQKWPRPGEKALEKFTKQNQVDCFHFYNHLNVKCPRILCTYLLGTLGKILRLFTISPQRLYLLNVEVYCTIQFTTF